MSDSTLTFASSLPELAESMAALTGWSDIERADAGDFARTRGALFHLCYSSLLHRTHAPDHARQVHLSLHRSLRLAPHHELLRPGSELILWHRASIRIAVEIIGHAFDCHWYAKDGSLSDLISEVGAEYETLMESIQRHVRIDPRAPAGLYPAHATNLRSDRHLR
ncbi:MAG: hypothetical protein IH568_01150 [Burkholderiaceae bacterium]|jgi:hypothetical protein|nr:hypothetical protein [Burkholderiaceae bacterium]